MSVESELSFVSLKKFEFLSKRVKFLEVKSRKQEDKIGILMKELDKIKSAINITDDHQLGSESMNDEVDVEVICDMPVTPTPNDKNHDQDQIDTKISPNVNLDDIVSQHLVVQLGERCPEKNSKYFNTSKSPSNSSKNTSRNQQNWTLEASNYQSKDSESIYNCTECHKTFTRPYNLALHKRIHTGERPYSCTFCSRSFNSSSNLKTHTRTHTGEKPYSCSICCLSFSRAISLRKHNVIHTGESSASCSICPQKFADRRLLNKHIIAVHQDRCWKNAK